MGITALALDRYADNTYSVAGKENYTGVDETSKSFGSHLSEASEKKCPYNFLAKDGIINYNGVIFECDYQQNAITLGNMYEKEKVLKIYLPSGGALHVNVDNIDQLSKAASMFTPEDLNAIMRAIHEYNHCTRKRYEIEEEKSKPIEDTAEENETPDAEKEPEIKENSTEQNPIITVSLGDYGSYNISVKDVDPKEATQIEMFALCSYMDDKNITCPGSFGSYNRLKSYIQTAIDMDELPDINNHHNSTKKINWLKGLDVAMKNQVTDQYSYQERSEQIKLRSYFEKQHQDIELRKKHGIDNTKMIETIQSF